jgi:hypothetical protein
MIVILCKHLAISNTSLDVGGVRTNFSIEQKSVKLHVEAYMYITLY